MFEQSKPVYFGVAGWSYPDWDDFVYTGRIRDKLRFLAGYVDMIEINNTFYRPPSAKDTQSWVKRTADIPDFFFSAKLHQDITHQGIIVPEMAQAFHRGFEPMIKEGKLRQLLAQFRYDFQDKEDNRAHLRAIQERFGDISELVFELRHISWQSQDALSFLAELGVTVANLDYPMARNSFNLQECLVGQNGYLRLHGRNAAAWFDRQAGRDQTYNYLYSKTELEGIKDRAMKLARHYKSLTIVANNHYQGKELANILQLKSMTIGGNIKIPSGLLQHYPALAEIASAQQDSTGKERDESELF